MILMVVDDDRLNLRIAEEHLHALYPDSQVLTCDNPLDVMSMLAAQDVDILFLDIVMPDRSGMEVLEEIRADSRYNDMPVIMLTSMTDMGHFRACFELGANDYVIKPIQIIEFEARLRAAVQIRSHMKLIREMYRQAKAQNSDLRRLNAQLRDAQFHMVQQEKLASIGELAEGVAHEINNPIGFVSSNLHTLKHFFDIMQDALANRTSCMETLLCHPDLPEVASNHIKRVQEKENTLKLPNILSELDATLTDSMEGISRVSKIIRTLRNFARSGKDNEFAPYSLDELVEEALLIVRHESKYSIDIHHKPGNCPNIPCNRGEIGQVLLNLLVNAIQAIHAQERTRRGNITIHTKSDNTHVQLTIDDDGPGIPQEQRNRIFDPFHTTKDAGQGTGLGLSISHDIIVKKHHGTLIVGDNPLGGARFVIRLPLNVKPAASYDRES